MCISIRTFGDAISPFALQNCAAKLGVPFFETSAKAGTNVEDAFLTMAQHLIEAKFVPQYTPSVVRTRLCPPVMHTRNSRDSLCITRMQESKSTKSPAGKAGGGKAKLDSGNGQKKKECCK